MARSPLFDVFDPNGDIAEQAALGLLDDDAELFEIGKKRRPLVSDLMPEEEKSGLLGTLANMGASGLATAGWLLDTPGAFVRGLLAGKPLSVFGSSEDRVTGRELARQWGMADKEDNWNNFTGGIGLEIALDPLTYASLGFSALGKGALTQAGKAAKYAGLLRNEALDSVARVNRFRQAKGLAAHADDFVPRVREYRRLATPRALLDEIAEPTARSAAEAQLRKQFTRFGVGDEGMDAAIGALDNVRVPGTNIGFDVGGGWLGDTLATGLDSLGNWTKTAPGLGHVTRTAAALFDPTVGDLGTLSPDLRITNELQLHKRMANAEALTNKEAMRREYGLLQADALNATVPDMVTSGHLAGTAVPEGLRSFESQGLWNAFDDYVRGARFQGPTLTNVPLGKTSGDEVADWVLENVPEFKKVRDYLDKIGYNATKAAMDLGLPTPQARSRGQSGFLPRQLRRFLDPQAPDIPGATPYQQRNWGRDERAFSVTDNFGRSRDPAYDLPGGNRIFRFLTGNAPGSPIDARTLQDALIAAPGSAERQKVLQDALDLLGQTDPTFTFAGSTRPYDNVLEDLFRSRKFQDAGRPMPPGVAGPAALSPRQQRMLTKGRKVIDDRYDQLSRLLMNADKQFADNGIGIFDTPAWNNALRYEMGQATNAANVKQLTAMLRRYAVDTPASRIQGGASIPLAEAARKLGYDPNNFRRMWQAQVGGDVTNYSIPESALNAMKALVPQTRLAAPERGILGAIDGFTNAFKVGALASPAFHVRNAYSGAYNAATQGAFNPLDYLAAFLASQGSPGMLQRRLPTRALNKGGTSARYAGMSPEEALREFKGDLAAHRISSGNAISDITADADPASIQGLFTGASNEPNIGQTVAQGIFGQPGRSWRDYLSDFLSLRGVGVTRNPRPYNTNPILAVNDAVGQGVEDMLRTGTFLNQIRKGVDPGVAGDLTRLTQLDYAPQAYTSFERNFMKRLMPFYSFQRQILPSIADNLLYRPGGLQGQTIRTITRGTEPSEDNFVPEHLRQSAAIPLPENWPSILGGSPAEGLKRYVTNIDLPFESTLNMFTPGVGTSTAARVADTFQKTGSNILGQTNPLLKAPLEYITNRQLYTGRELSDLYSVLEQDLGPIGRPVEQAVVNLVPFGARGVSIYRQLNDDRLTPGEAALKALFNQTAGVKLTDVDADRAKRLAARNMLNSILETTPGVKTYENISVPNEALMQMPEEQRRLYLLYRILQSDAAKRARERKKSALDPLQVLGAVR